MSPYQRLSPVLAKADVDAFAIGTRAAPVVTQAVLAVDDRIAGGVCKSRFSEFLVEAGAAAAVNVECTNLAVEHGPANHFKDRGQ